MAPQSFTIPVFHPAAKVRFNVELPELPNEVIPTPSFIDRQSFLSYFGAYENMSSAMEISTCDSYWAPSLV
ncbi:hypothetical protein VC83_00835 [Pseudogymnoascus destructans]|uniref:Uncharacterized protein n=2 Tax=Pseudogymnoascus destructans TaxID=655981 RepID=L8FQI0_PSED2|nr:uncharacterized protein VC83_00835 [Pseudogymnoascus destructans]ELR02728.1 hypothetical protein GMDG_05674 [Pseudogymnoascus destructans 20631-21]OAF62718.1 hypothetical protein VC83_00835 [Pseudogymnoascus destructans]